MELAFRPMRHLIRAGDAVTERPPVADVLEESEIFPPRPVWTNASAN